MKRFLPARWNAALRPEAVAQLALPGEMVHEARRRVLVGAAIGTAAYAAFLLLELSGAIGGSVLEHRIDLAHDALGVLLCATLLLAASLRSIGDRSLLGIALVAEVLLCLLISFAAPWAASVRTGHLASLTWVVPVIILFPLLVPLPSRTSLLVSGVCALTMPLGLAVLGASGRIAPRPADFWAAIVTGSVAVGIATVAARTIYRAGTQVAAARMVGSYELTERLGQGGMGEVWKARHLFLARPAAVKLILPEQLQGPAEAREAAVQRFTREAQVTAGLRSNHTVQLFDFGIGADGACYYAMELLDGLNAEHFVYRFGPIPPRRAVHWLRQACHSLGEAHANGMLHRDIKPANLYVCRYGRDVDVVKVLDFGLSRPAVAQGDHGLTAPGTILGTPGYMAPEQVFGLATEPRTDLYALGCVGYWLMAGTKPFEADSAGDLMRRHALEPPPPLSGKCPHAVPPRLEAVIMACLSKDPADRPKDADALSEQLGASLDEAPWSPREAQEWWNANWPRS